MDQTSQTDLTRLVNSMGDIPAWKTSQHGRHGAEGFDEAVWIRVRSKDCILELPITVRSPVADY